MNNRIYHGDTENSISRNLDYHGFSFAEHTDMIKDLMNMQMKEK